MANPKNNSEESGLIFSQENSSVQKNDSPSHLYNPGISFPLMIIGVGTVFLNIYYENG
jgi:hypothetical protein